MKTMTSGFLVVRQAVCAGSRRVPVFFLHVIKERQRSLPKANAAVIGGNCLVCPKLQSRVPELRL